MKKKLVMLTEPVPTKKKGRVATVQMAGSILILNLYQDRKLDRRYCMDTETGEYQTWCAEDSLWRQEKIKVALGGRYDGAYGVYGGEKLKYDPPGAGKQAEDVLERLDRCDWRTGVVGKLDWVETQYVSRQRERKEDRRIERLNDLMRKIPDVPDGFLKWTLRIVGGGKHYAFWERDSKTYECTSCGKTHTEEELPGKHNMAAACPATGEPVVIKRLTQRMQERSNVCLMQDVDENISVCRYFDVRIKWEGKTEYVELSEAVRIMPKRRSVKPCEIYYNQYNSFSGYQSFDRHNPANRRIRDSYLYPEEIRECLAGTYYSGWVTAFGTMAQAGVKANYNNLMTAQGNHGLAGMLEYLTKGRFFRLAQEVADRTWTQYRGTLIEYGRNAQEVLGISDVQKINRIRDEDGGEMMVEWMRWSEQEGQKISREAMCWLEKEQINPDVMRNLSLSPQKLMNYIVRQKRESYPNLSARQIVEQYRDYLAACKRQKKDLTDEMVYKPRELKRRHDELIEEIRKVQMIEQMKHNEEAARKREAEMREKYPGAEENLAAAAGIYSFSGEEFSVIVPKTLSEIVLEGNALHHCVGSSERYFERIMRRETYVFFLRRTPEPDVPYYTLEVEPGGTIRQTRTMYDEETGIEDVRAFLRQWQREVKKRLTEQERELAKISAVKREENIKELQEKNNTRVLKALLEDFMEAV